jgi:hypothetical protein
MIKIKLILFLLIIFCNHYVCQINKITPINNCSDSIIKNNSFYIIGENHYMNGNVEIAFKLFKQLYYNNGVRIFVFERGYSEIYLIDRLINKGDSSVCNLFIDNYFKKLYDLLYSFNKELSEHEKIHLVGLDRESYNRYSYLSIYLILKEQSLKNQELNNLFISYENDYYTLNDERLRKQISFIEKKIISDTVKYENLLGTDSYFNLKKIIDSYFYKDKGDLNKIKKEELNNARELRESFMYNNFKEFNKLYHHSSYFGYFGKLHIYKYNDGLWLNLKKWESFAYKLNNEEFKSEVVSFDLIYKYSPVIFSRLFKIKSFY